MNTIDEQLTEWKEIRKIWAEARCCIGEERVNRLKELNYKVKMYNLKYETRFDFFNKPNESKKPIF